MVFHKYDLLKIKDGRETVFINEIGYPKGQFSEDVRHYANGLLNSHGGVIYFGVNGYGQIIGAKISRKEEDDYRLAVDHVFGSFQPFVSANHYRLTFLEVKDREKHFSIIELKVSVGEIGEIYEDGFMKVYLVDKGGLIGPLFPQELKELILLKYKESLEGAEQAARYATPNLTIARENARRKMEPDKRKIIIGRGLEKIVENEELSVSPTTASQPKSLLQTTASQPKSLLQTTVSKPKIVSLQRTVPQAKLAVVEKRQKTKYGSDFF